MGIKLTWSSEATSVKIYRSTTPFTKLSLPSVVATVGATGTWEDTSVVANTVYYYMLELTYPSGSVFSALYVKKWLPNYGPGSSNLLSGSWESGVLGYLTKEEFLTDAEFLALYPGCFTVPRTFTRWVKTVLGNKILIFPNKLYCVEVNLLDAYNAGCLLRSDTVGYTTLPAGVTGVMQDARVTVKGNTYKLGVFNNFGGTKEHTHFSNIASGLYGAMIETDWAGSNYLDNIVTGYNPDNGTGTLSDSPVARYASDTDGTIVMSSTTIVYTMSYSSFYGRTIPIFELVP